MLVGAEHIQLPKDTMSKSVRLNFQGGKVHFKSSFKRLSGGSTFDCSTVWGQTERTPSLLSVSRSSHPHWLISDFVFFLIRLSAPCPSSLSLCVCIPVLLSLYSAGPGELSRPEASHTSHTHQLLMSLDSNTLFKRVAELQSMLDRCVILSVKRWLAELSDSLALIVKRNSNYSVLFCQEIKWESVEHHL